jgi:hypothetical protein
MKEETMKLKIGNRYKDRGGYIVEIVGHATGVYPFEGDNGCTFTEEGKEWYHGGKSSRDLISEVDSSLPMPSDVYKYISALTDVSNWHEFALQASGGKINIIRDGAVLASVETISCDGRFQNLTIY